MTDQDNTPVQANPAPPVPNPMFDGINRFPVPAVGPNWPLLWAVREFIAALPVADVPDDDTADVPEDTDPNGWVQDTWRCGTGMCFAGWGVALAGATFPYEPYSGNWVPVSPPGLQAPACEVADYDGKLWRIRDLARELFGLDDNEANVLFDGGNDLARIDYALNNDFASPDDDDEYDDDDDE
jgi:hypothetical protein